MICRNKKKFLCMLPLLAACLMLFIGCKENNYNYPKTVFIPAEGGEVTIDGDMWPLAIQFLNGDTFVTGTITHEEERDATIYEYGWLSVETIRFKRKMTFIAPPNENSKQRSMTISPTFPSEYYCTIKVTQGAK